MQIVFNKCDGYNVAEKLYDRMPRTVVGPTRPKLSGWISGYTGSMDPIDVDWVVCQQEAEKTFEHYNDEGE